MNASDAPEVDTTSATDNHNKNVRIAFALVLAAAASTGLGAAVVFIPSLVKLASRRFLGGSLGFSAGVMIYVSFVEIFNKSKISFQDAGHDEDRAYIYATLCLFGGVFFMLVSYKQTIKTMFEYIDE
jgi:ZIP family zinc transporter